MRWLFVIGVALEIPGALLMIVPLLKLLHPHFRERLQSMGVNLELGNEPSEEVLEPIAYAIVGGALLSLGFLAQLIGYLLSYSEQWCCLLLAALAVTVLSLGGGILLAQGKIMRQLQRLAKRQSPDS
jgi:hypothetical protein